MRTLWCEVNTRATFVLPVSDDMVCEKNFLASPFVRTGQRGEILLQRGFASAALAYNDAVDRAANDLLILVHQDVFLPESWPFQMEASLRYLEAHNPNWGVLGCYGVTVDGRHVGHCYSHGLGILGKPFSTPVRVRTLDEMVLIVRKSRGLRFDERLAHWHLYGTDICLEAEKRGMSCYSIPAFCIHNTRQLGCLPPDFDRAYDQVKEKWRDRLPIQTPCTSISKCGRALLKNRLQRKFPILRRRRVAMQRDPSPEALFVSVMRQVRTLSEPDSTVC